MDAELTTVGSASMFWRQLSVEKTPELHHRHQYLFHLVGYYALVLETIPLSEEWHSLYTQRKEELEEELNAFNNHTEP